MKRPTQPEERSFAYVFLAAPCCFSYINGAILPVQGGPTDYPSIHGTTHATQTPSVSIFLENIPCQNNSKAAASRSSPPMVSSSLNWKHPVTPCTTLAPGSMSSRPGR